MDYIIKPINIKDIIPIEFEDKDYYLRDIDNILFADTGRVDAMNSNTFFSEAGQLLINAIHLFEQGYFDCAFYSLRQSLEVSIGTLYLTANSSKLKSWNKQEDGFESGKMVAFLKENEPTFKEIRLALSDYFTKIRRTKLFIDKYVHKQGYKTFYAVRKSFEGQKIFTQEKLVNDFKRCLTDCIGAVAIYRLAIDPMPVLLMDENIEKKMRQMMAEPFSENFIAHYIGVEHIDKYKQTEMYQSYYDAFNQNETQNEALYEIIHCEFVDREKENLILEQVHLLSSTERIAVGLFFLSKKISQVYLEDGWSWYFSNVKSHRTDAGMQLGKSYYENVFTSLNNYNELYKGIYISRCKIDDKYQYIEHNDVLDYSEIESINQFAETMDKQIAKVNAELNDLYESMKDTK